MDLPDREYQWNDDKDHGLTLTRGISFEELLVAAANGHLLDVIESPSRRNQKMLVVELRGYAYLVPFIENSDWVFLKTAYPNRDATRKYLALDKGGPKNEET